MTKLLNVMAIQMSSVLGKKETNIKKIENLIDKNITKETDVIFLPEVWTVGWACEYFTDSAETFSSGFASSVPKNDKQVTRTTTIVHNTIHL